MKRLLLRILIGFLLGTFLSILIPLVFSGEHIVSVSLQDRAGSFRAALLIQMMLCGLYGAGTMTGTLLYESERLNLPVATVLHCAICIGPFVPLALFLGWFDGFPSILPFVGIQFAAFFLIWLIMFLLGRREVMKLNRLQQKLNGETEPRPQSESGKGDTK